jgi:hypothetical protein
MHISTPLLLSLPLPALSLSERAWPTWSAWPSLAPLTWPAWTDQPLPTPTPLSHHSPITLPSSCKTACSAASTFCAGWANWDGNSNDNYLSSWSNFCHDASSTAEASSCASCFSSAWSTATRGDGWGWGWGNWGMPTLLPLSSTHQLT